MYLDSIRKNKHQNVFKCLISQENHLDFRWSDLSEFTLTRQSNPGQLALEGLYSPHGWHRLIGKNGSTHPEPRECECKR